MGGSGSVGFFLFLEIWQLRNREEARLARYRRGRLELYKGWCDVGLGVDRIVYVWRSENKEDGGGSIDEGFV